MKKKTITIILILLAVCIAAALLFALRPAAVEEPAVQVTPSPEPEPTEEPLPEPGTVVLDKDGKITASIGVAEGDDESEDDGEQVSEPSETPESGTETSPSPTPDMPKEPVKSSYEVFSALAPEQKDEFMHSFESMDAFYDWLVAAQAEYAAVHPEIEIKPGETIDLSKLGQ